MIGKPEPGFKIEGQGFTSELLRVSGRPIYKHQADPIPNGRKQPQRRDPIKLKIDHLLDRWERAKRYNVDVRQRMRTQSSPCLPPMFRIPCWKSIGQWWMARGVAFEKPDPLPNLPRPRVFRSVPGVFSREMARSPRKAILGVPGAFSAKSTRRCPPARSATGGPESPDRTNWWRWCPGVVPSGFSIWYLEGRAVIC